MRFIFAAVLMLATWPVCAQEYDVKLTAQELQTIGAALAALCRPFGEVGPIINKMSQQVAAQQNKHPEPKPADK